MELSNAVTLITGGASGLGEATARFFAQNGAIVYILDLDKEKGHTIQSENSHIHYIETDVTDESAVSKAINLILQNEQKLNIAISCAGIAEARKTIGKVDGIYGPHSLDAFEKTIRINLIGTFNILRLAASAMESNTPNTEGERGVIINTASIAAYDGQIGQVAYAASKGAIVSMTLPAARDLAKSGIRVMTIAPGLFETPLLDTIPEDARQSLGRQVPFPSRLGRPNEYALLAKSIVENPMLNGETIRLDGAIRMAPK